MRIVVTFISIDSHQSTKAICVDLILICIINCRGSSIGRACGSYARTPQGRGFEPRLRLYFFCLCNIFFSVFHRASTLAYSKDSKILLCAPHTGISLESKIVHPPHVPSSFWRLELSLVCLLIVTHARSEC